jgi:hypothetical protein
MLQCEWKNAAMQKNALLLVSGIPRLPLKQDAALSRNTGRSMSKTASFGYAPPTTLFGRLMAAFDRLLMTNAHIAIRNGDLPHFGL